MSDQSSKKFTDFLVSQLPVYDRLILQDIRPTDSWVLNVEQYSFLKIDVRLLPNSLRKIWASNCWQLNLASTKRVARELGLRRKTVVAMWVDANQMMPGRVHDWLAKLPKRMRRKETLKRRAIQPYQTVEGTLDRFRSVFPNTTANWK